LTSSVQSTPSAAALASSRTRRMLRP
jgi:hypothetical protein